MDREKVTQVSTSFGFTIILTKSGKVYSMGTNINGQLGLGFKKSRIISPCLIDPKWFDYDKVIEISTGICNSLALTQNGNVYIWGHYQKLAIDMFGDDHCFPKKINSNRFSNQKIKHISCGSLVSCYFLVTENNEVYSCGFNENFQLGLGGILAAMYPSLIDSSSYNNEKIKKIKCVKYHTCLLTENGKVYTCGANFHCQLGIDIVSDNVSFTFRLVTNNDNDFSKEKIIDIESGSFHSICLSETGKIYTWGENDSGECGLNDIGISKKVPHLIDPKYFYNEKIIAIGCGKLSSLALSASGKIYFWGLMDQNKLPLMGKPNIFKNLSNEDCVICPSQVENVFLKGEKVIALNANKCCFNVSFTITKTGKLFMQGDNSQGQLGLSNCENRNSLVRCNSSVFGKDSNDKMYKNLSFGDIVIEF